MYTKLGAQPRAPPSLRCCELPTADNWYPTESGVPEYSISHLCYSGCSPKYADALQIDFVFRLEHTARYTGLYHDE